MNDPINFGKRRRANVRTTAKTRLERCNLVGRLRSPSKTLADSWKQFAASGAESDEEAGSAESSSSGRSPTL